MSEDHIEREMPPLPKTHRQQVNSMAAAIARVEGWEPLAAYVDNRNPRARKFCRMAEAAFEALTGDRPDYAD